MTDADNTLDEIKRQFVDLHRQKEDLFWTTKMALAEDPAEAQRKMADAEIRLNRFLQDPERLAMLRSLAKRRTLATDTRHILEGWIAMFAANVIEDPAARRLSEEIVELEGELQSVRAQMPLGFRDPDTGQLVRASSVRLALMMRSDPSEARRKAAYQGLQCVETFVLEHGFLDIVRKRNRLARMLGHEDYYAWRLAVAERMSKARVFEMLEDLANRTAQRMRTELEKFARKHGDRALEPWNFPYLRSGELIRELDPYFRFDSALERWGRSFHRMGIRYRGATLTLDLVDRPGKYENGFMHGPEVAFSDAEGWHPARINFTANAVPGQRGSGLRAAETLFHEGGHAAHFSNILADAPCFSHEFAPTSVAYAETQSMFLDSLLGDAAWRMRYATDAQGRPMPQALIEWGIEERQPFRGWDMRALLTVPFGEKALYELPDEKLEPETVLALFRRIEREMQGLTAGVRPLLAVPHLLAGESSAYYHAYVVAEMAVYQTRRFFLGRDGYLVDNPRIGPDLARTYWAPGNAVSFDQTLVALTGKPLSADALVEDCVRGTDEAIASARQAMTRLAAIPAAGGAVDLDATIHVVHGARVIASTDDGGFESACRAFAGWVSDLEREQAAREGQPMAASNA